MYDPTSGEMVYIPAGTQVFVEVGAIAGKDVHSLKAYVTAESAWDLETETKQTCVFLCVFFICLVILVVLKAI